MGACIRGKKWHADQIMAMPFFKKQNGKSHSYSAVSMMVNTELNDAKW